MGRASVEVRPETRRSRCQVGRRGRRGRANPRPAKDLVVVNRSRSIAFGWCTPAGSCSSWPRSQGADRGRGGAAHRRAVRDRARHHRQARRGAAGGPGGAGRAPGPAELEAWLRVQHARVSRKSETGKAIAYALNHWKALTRFLGRRPDLPEQQRGRAGAARGGRRAGGTGPSPVPTAAGSGRPRSTP